ncbi:MAG: hypothetical protein ACYTF6_05355 [Planctomycetota bacterium]
MRAFRPGRYAAVVDEKEVEEIKRVKMQIYAARAKARLPLFEDAPSEGELEARQSGHSEDRLSA